MQPHDRRPGKRAASRAVRTALQKHLGWLRGFPWDVTDEGTVAWEVVSDLQANKVGEAIVVDRDKLRRAAFGRNGRAFKKS